MAKQQSLIISPPHILYVEHGKEEEKIPKSSLDNDFWLSLIGEDWKSIPRLATWYKEGILEKSSLTDGYIVGKTIGFDFLKYENTDRIRTLFFYRRKYQGSLPMDLTFTLSLQELSER